ncbi:MAG: YkgJ family cysteine cluster protein [Pseudomonadota bacterium]
MKTPMPVYPKASRANFPQFEKRQSWLSPLLDAYFITDQGVQEGIKREEKQGRKLACGKSCSNCCKTHATIPVYPLELMGMSLYIIEILSGDIRQKLKQQLKNLSTHQGCPFLIENSCSIHPLRPMACRQFNVFEKPCEETEDAYYSRRHDVLTPIKKYTDQALDSMLPFYGIKNKAERRKAIKIGQIHQYAKVMRDLSWENMLVKMKNFDKQ